MNLNRKEFSCSIERPQALRSASCFQSTESLPPSTFRSPMHQPTPSTKSPRLCPSVYHVVHFLILLRCAPSHLPIWSFHCFSQSLSVVQSPTRSLPTRALALTLAFGLPITIRLNDGIKQAIMRCFRR